MRVLHGLYGFKLVTARGAFVVVSGHVFVGFGLSRYLCLKSWLPARLILLTEKAASFLTALPVMRCGVRRVLLSFGDGELVEGEAIWESAGIGLRILHPLGLAIDVSRLATQVEPALE